MKILAIDSSGMTATVALLEDDKLIGEYTVDYKKTHSQTLLPMIKELTDLVETDFTTIDAVAVAKGPGSFTGLRIGSASAKGLAMAWGKPIAEIPAVDAMAYNLYGCRDIICPVMDARRGQVYTGFYTFDYREGGYVFRVLKEQFAEDMAAVIGELNRIGKETGQGVVFLGDGVPVFAGQIRDGMQVPYAFAPASHNRQHAASLGVLAKEAVAAGRCVDAAKHRPEYLRMSQAERERQERLEKVYIRRMCEQDIGQIARMEAACFTSPWSREAFTEALANPSAVYMTALTGDEVAGYCGAYRILDEADINQVAVAPAYRGRGIGRKLLEALLDALQKDGILAVTLEVRKSNAAAVALYEALGFVTEGVRPGFYEKPVEDALIMWKR